MKRPSSRLGQHSAINALRACPPERLAPRRAAVRGASAAPQRPWSSSQIALATAQPPQSADRRINAGAASRVSIHGQDDSGLRLSVDSLRMSYAIAQAHHVEADDRPSYLDERSEFVAAEQLSLAIDLGATGSLEILGQAIVVATTRSVRIL